MFKIGSEYGKPGRIQNWYYNFVTQRDRIVLDDLKTRDLFQPRLTIAKIAAFLIAGLVHSITVILLLLGLWIIIRQLGGYCSICYGLFLFGIAFIIRPHFTPCPPNVLSRTQFPSLYEFVDLVADALNTAHIDAIVIDARYNAGFTYFGIQQSSLLILGYPLWIELNAQERVALIGHELAHQMNKDFTRSFFVGSALNSLQHWFALIYPDSLVDRRYGAISLPANFFMWAFANGIRAVYMGLSQILLYEKRRAEYLADYLGASVGGTDGLTGLLQAFQRHDPTISINALSDHPSNLYRLELMASKPEMSPTLILEDDYAKRIDKELSALQAGIEAQMRRLKQGDYGSARSYRDYSKL